MDVDELTLEEKCEHLMNVVVESRKQFGKRSVEYELKCTLLENQILKYRLETISNTVIKPQKLLLDNKLSNMKKNVEELTLAVAHKQKCINDIRKIVNTNKRVVEQLQNDKINKKARAGLTAEVMLARAKCRDVKLS